MHTPTDYELVLRAKRGDTDGLSLLYERYAHGMYCYLLRLTGDPEIADDLRADVFLRMVERIDCYEDRGWPFSAWLYRIARGRVIDTMRRNRYRTSSALFEHSLVCDGPERLVDIAGSHSDLYAAIAALSPEQSAVIAWRYIDDVPVAEVARRLGRSTGAVKALQHRGLQNLARRMGAV